MNDVYALSKTKQKLKILWHISISILILLKILFLCLLVFSDCCKIDLCIGFVSPILIYTLYFLITEEYRTGYLSWCLIGWPAIVGRDLADSFTAFGSVYLFATLCLNTLFLLLTWKFRKISKAIDLVSCQKEK